MSLAIDNSKSVLTYTNSEQKGTMKARFKINANVIVYYQKEATCCTRNNEPVSVRQKQIVRRSVAQRCIIRLTILAGKYDGGKQCKIKPFNHLKF